MSIATEILMVTNASILGIDIYCYIIDGQVINLYCVNKDLEKFLDLPKTHVRIEGDKRSEVLQKATGMKVFVDEDNCWIWF